MTDPVDGMPPTSQFAVAAGNVYREWNHTDDVDAQRSDVSEIKIPPRYQGFLANFQDDIALLILVNEFRYNEYVQAACINFSADFDEEQLEEGKFGKVVGWGLTNANSGKSRVLRAATFPCVNINKCIAQSPLSFKSSITGDKICAGYTNGRVLLRMCSQSF
ncbi:hypothetical protein O3G_MSEX012155 [Manduca sexta]|uniref:Peptidase S1 domain-containing protein n=1 Tax=Manduca sexta TaxID=7130 RepID=A0A921ZNV9_MANSE|nr:hypothetical protein O3G_MSEX012155 [Manduca sexta]